MKLGQIVLAFLLAIACVAGVGWYLSPIRELTQELIEVPNFDEKGQYYRANPFQKEEQMTPAAKVETDIDLFDFGRMGLGDKGSHDYVIRNTGTAPLKLAKGPVQCKCTLANLEGAEVPPGGETVIKLEWEPKDMGPFAQEATIWTSDPAKPVLKLTVKGTMFRKLGYFPPDGWNMGTLGSESVQFEGFVYSQIFESFQITELVPSSDRIAVQFEPTVSDRVPEQDSKVAYRVFGTLSPIAEAGEMSESITVKTNLEAPLNEIVMGISATRLGPISIVGPGWFAKLSAFNLERVSAEKGKTFQYTMLVTDQSEEFNITEITSDPQFLDISVKKTTETEAGSRYTLTIRIPPNSPSGLWTMQEPGKVTFKTTHSKLAELTYKIAIDLR